MIVRPKIRIDGILYRDRGRPVWGEIQKQQRRKGARVYGYSQGVEEDEKEEVLCRTQKRQPKIKDAQEGRSAVKDKKKKGSKTKRLSF